MNHTAKAQLRLAAFAIVAALLAACSTQREAAPPPVVATSAGDPWSAWGNDFRAAMDACVQAKADNCLAQAFTSHPRPPSDSSLVTVSGDLTRDLRTAQAMLAVPAAVNALWREYGIDNVLYLGTGYSVPVTAGTAGYWQAQQREYFLPNLCAQPIDPVACPTADADVWTWRLPATAAAAFADKPVAQLLIAKPATGDESAIAQRLTTERTDGMPGAFIRFGKLDATSYKGTFGRADAKRVFFSDYAQLRDKTLGDALAGTGSTSLLTGAKPGQIFFVWIYAPGEQSKAQPASWHALFEALDQSAAH